MLQRVQSLYLLCSIVFLAIFAFTPYFNITTNVGTYELDCMGITLSMLPEIATGTAVITASSNYIVAIITALIAIMSAITIFLYKNRNKQILICRVNILFYITMFVVMGILVYNNYTLLQGTAMKPTSYLMFPICALITNCLAMGAINKDEQMVRDSERMWTRNR